MMIAEVEVTNSTAGGGGGSTTKDRLNILDSYHEMAPLHYAIQQTPINKDIVEALLQSGADPNLPDGEKKSPMYYGTSVCVPADLFVSLRKSEILIFVRFLLFLCVRIVAERNELDEEIIE